MIENKIKELEEELRKNKKKYDKKEIISLLSGVFFASFGLVMSWGLPVCGLSMIAISLGLFATNKNIKKRRTQTENRLNQEIEHLRKVEKGSLNASKEMSAKRYEKLTQLTKSLKNKKRKLKSAKTKNNLALAGLGLSALFTPIVPIVGLAGSAIFALTKVYTGQKLNEENQKVETLLNRVHNIGNDVEIIATSKNKIQSKKVVNQQEKQQARPKVVARKVTPSRRREINKNEGIVKQYIDRIASTKTDSRSQDAKKMQKTK